MFASDTIVILGQSRSWEELFMNRLKRKAIIFYMHYSQVLGCPTPPKPVFCLSPNISGKGLMQASSVAGSWMKQVLLLKYKLNAAVLSINTRHIQTGDKLQAKPT